MIIFKVIRIFLISAFSLTALSVCPVEAKKKEVKESVEPEPAPVDSAMEANKHYSFAKNYEKNKMYEDAERQYRSALSYAPANPKMHYSFGKLLWEQSREAEKQAKAVQDGRQKAELQAHREMKMDETKAEFLKTIQLNPDHFNGHWYLAQIYQYMDVHNDSAIVMLEQLVRFKPDDPSFRSRLGRVYLLEERHGEALPHYRKLSELKGNSDPEILSTVAKLSEMFGEYEETIAAYKRVFGLKPDDFETLDAMAVLQYQHGYEEDALASFKLLAKKGKEIDRYMYLSRVAELAEKLGGIQDQIGAYREMVALNPKDIQSIGKLAEYYFNQEKLREANGWIEKGLKVDPKSGHMRVLKGEYYLGNRNEDAALAEFEKALVDPLWKGTAQHKIWEIKPPLTEEEKRLREFFGKDKEEKKGG